MEHVITLNDVGKTRGSFALDIPQMEVHKGYITGFIGENGAGKTTTMHLIMDVLRPDRGEIGLLGGSARKDPVGIKRQIGFVDSMNCFTGGLRIGDVRRIVAPFFPDWDDALFQGYCRRFGLSQEGKVKDLSTGKGKLLNLVVALSHRPKLLILDEPTSSLDPVVRSELLDLFSQLLQDGETSIFYSTHITSDLDKTADYIIYMHQGRIVLQGEKDQILNDYCVVKGDPRLLEDMEEGELVGVRKSAVGFVALCADRRRAAERFGDQVRLEKPTLEDLMIYTAREDM